MLEQPVAEGRQILVVEDEMIIALSIEDALLGLGASVVGPVSRLERALQLARESSLDAAILDVNILGGNSYPIADVLAERQIPFLFCSGYSEWALEERHRDRPRLTKPYSSKELTDMVLQLFAGTR
ncbi:MAG TPA: response regulator [Mesorhizobium sp.]|jgi:CheY-like chemotaxis protein|uniref:response regulator n=1 Tax=Mesorhizobium sp. TaxID=1871066 RepID=UPI002DDCEE58|nr:response regulator [Mesorhizobium sp.]HEV2506701.1 response regulator [Mesorhizobium sp.]